MESTFIHVCLETAGSPAGTSGHQIGERWVCSCGDNYVYREGFTRSGHASVEWWPAPAIPRQRTARRGLLFGPRKG
jgi:hypothetical protein